MRSLTDAEQHMWLLLLLLTPWGLRVGPGARAPTPALLLSLLQHLAPTGSTPGPKLADGLPWYVVRYALGVRHPVHGAQRET
jgi:hypothetical protein